MNDNQNNTNSMLLPGEEGLLAIDANMATYARKNKLRIDKNCKKWPERSFSWKSRGINKQIQIYLDKNGKDWLIWAVAYKDTISKKRFLWKQNPKILPNLSQWQNVEHNLDILRERLNNIQRSDLIK